MARVHYGALALLVLVLSTAAAKTQQHKLRTVYLFPSTKEVKDCGGNHAGVSWKHFTATPDPPVPGQSLIVNGTGTAARKITGGCVSS